MEIGTLQQMNKMNFQSLTNNLTPILYASALALFIIGIIVWVNINANDSVKVKGDKRLVVAIFLLVPIIVVQFLWSRKNCDIAPLQKALESF